MLVTIVSQPGDIEYQDTVAFTPDINGRAGVEITLGITKMLVKVAWSLIEE